MCEKVGMFYTVYFNGSLKVQKKVVQLLPNIFTYKARATQQALFAR